MLKASIDKLLDSAIILILGVMALLVATNVFCRFVLGFSIYWGDELALVLMVWLTFLGAAVAVRERAHYVFDFLVNRLHGAAKRRALIIRDLLNIAAPLILGIYSAEVALKVHFWIMPAMEISRSVVYAACPVGCLFMLGYSVQHLIRNIREPEAAR